MSVYFETYRTVIQSTSMADFSLGFTGGTFLLLNGRKHLISVAEDLTSDKQKSMVVEMVQNSTFQNFLHIQHSFIHIQHLYVFSINIY